ncbi:SH3 domain-containing protein [Limibaculum sp. M0105]|uniref:SH3 domain-containing protein n=1 Tax=Thermohalobaculum xanthum TaxID=2753746 RepID=A0A8J7M7M2_9RHOB|nr:SH3 domain-containing protein [Thermohalobaculum xanthum]MBK0399024.1 SH3 domain-containing protein [Thermohalobaculum xanthum]
MKLRFFKLESHARAGLAIACLLASALPAGGADVPLSAGEGGPRHWEVTGVQSSLALREGPTTASRRIARLAPGAILTNLGCEDAGGRVWCDVQPFRGGPRGFAAHEFLKHAQAPDGSYPTGEDPSALRAGRGDFDARGPLGCAFADGQPMGECAFGVARGGGGDATVVVDRPDGLKRAIFVVRGAPVGADTSEADGYHDFTTHRAADVYRVQIGQERYEIVDAIVFGG